MQVLHSHSKKTADNGTSIDLSWESASDDVKNKYYKVFQSQDNKNWYNAKLAYSAKDGQIPSDKNTYTPGTYDYTVPLTGNYKIKLSGAQGGNIDPSISTGGLGGATEGTSISQRR